MASADTIKTLLAADATLAGYLTGGFFTVANTGRLGINRDMASAPYDTGVGGTGLLKPCLLIKTDSGTTDGGITDDTLQVMSMREIHRLWFYADGDAGYATIRLARARAYVLLHGKTLTGLFGFRWFNEITDGHEPTLENACFERDDYESRRLRTA